MYTSPELQAATDKLRAAAKKNNVILGLFLFGTARVGEFLEKGFPFISLGNDLHHILTQAGAYVKDVEAVSKDKGSKPGPGGLPHCYSLTLHGLDRQAGPILRHRSDKLKLS